MIFQQKNMFRYASLLAMGAIICISPSVLAEANTPVSSTPATSTNANASDTTSAAGSSNAALPKKLADRVTQYKTKQVFALTTAQEAKLKGSCKAAQAKLTGLTTASGIQNATREKTYNNIVKKLETITTRIKDADVDTAELDSVNTELTKLITQYKDDYLILKTNLDDISDIDCLTDPAAFKAALLTARANREVLVKDATAIRQYVPTIVLKLNAAKEALAKEAATSDTDTTNTSDASNATNTAGGNQ